MAISMEIDDAIGSVLDSAASLGKQIGDQLIVGGGSDRRLAERLDQCMLKTAEDFGRLGLTPRLAGLAMREVLETAESAIRNRNPKQVEAGSGRRRTLIEKLKGSSSHGNS